MFSSILLAPLLLRVSFAAPILEQRQSSCAEIHIIAARGSTEAPGPGSLSTLATLIQAAYPGTDLESIVYPALLYPYDESSSNGTAAVTSQLTEYVNECPDSKVVLIGYSQGAQILLDSLCGGGGVFGLGPATPPINPSISSHVTAIVQYGDPRHLANEPYDEGTSDHNGLFPRILPSQNCNAFADIIHSWCDAGDPFCSDGFDLAAHLDYPTKYDTDAAAFVQSILG